MRDDWGRVSSESTIEHYIFELQMGKGEYVVICSTSSRRFFDME